MQSRNFHLLKEVVHNFLQFLLLIVFNFLLILTLTNVIVINFVKLFVKIQLINTIRKQYFELDNYS
jgi:hypothetical protein